MRKMRPDDPRYTAYALGETDPNEAEIVEETVEVDNGLEDEFAKTQALGKLLCEAFEREGLALRPGQRAVIRQVSRSRQALALPSARKGAEWLRGLGFSAVALGGLAAGLLVMARTPIESDGSEGMAESLEMDVVLQPVSAAWWGAPEEVETVESAGAVKKPENAVIRQALESPQKFFASAERSALLNRLPAAEVFPKLKENHHLSSSEKTSFPVPVIAGRTSFSWVKRYLREEGQLPPRDAVRLEELVNYPDYREDPQARAGGVALASELVPCPWNEDCLLLGVLIQRELKIDEDVEVALRLDVEEDVVDSLRLLGFARAGEGVAEASHTGRPLAAGNSTYVIYEIRPKEQAVNEEILGKLALKVTTRGTSEYQNLRVSAKPQRWLESSDSFRTAATVAAYALVLRDSSYKGTLNLARVESLARQTLLDLERPNRETREVLKLIVDTRRLAGLMGTARLDEDFEPAS